MFFLFPICIKTLYFSQATAGEYFVNLTAGVYNVSCYGAQGGGSFIGGSISSKAGGKGALASGIITVTGDGAVFWGYVGGMGTRTLKAGPNAGGYNGGGWGGRDNGGLTGSGDDAPGGGGGATELRFNDNNFDSRVIVGAGGSGAADKCDGAPGGGITGYHKKSGCVLTESTNVVDQSYGSADGRGLNGTECDFIPGSGGGGGWRGGPGGSCISGESNSYLSVGHSGSSYVSGHAGCSRNKRLSFYPTSMAAGLNSVTGWIRIEQTYACPDNCFACSTSGCTTCYEPFFLEAGKCVLKCSDGYYASQLKNCYTCSTNCKTCDINRTHCTSCEDSLYFYDYKCLSKCDDGFYAYQGKCLKCHEPCLTCESKTKCSTCIDNYFLNTDQCVSRCPLGTILINNSCERCENHCKSCHPSAEVCTSCEENFYLHESKCVESCPNGTVAKDGQCVDCKSPCDGCSTAADFCTSCIDNFFLHNNTCVGHCPPGTTLVGAVCEECTNHCATCSSSVDHCLSCEEGFYLYENKCYSSCTDLNDSSGSKFFGKNKESQTCTLCKDSLCADCSEDITVCDKCFEGFSQDGRCVETCDDGFFIKNNKCIACNSPCAICTGSSSRCVRCKTGFFMSGGECVEECPRGMYGIEEECKNCPSECTECISETFCTGCIDRYNLEDGKCVWRCASGEVEVGGVCEKCEPYCKTCHGTAIDCTSCVSGYYLHGRKCVSSCPDETFEHGEQCVDCKSPCRTCRTTSEHCTTCIDGFYLIENENRCVASCPPGMIVSGFVCLYYKTI